MRLPSPDLTTVDHPPSRAYEDIAPEIRARLETMVGDVRAWIHGIVEAEPCVPPFLTRRDGTLLALTGRAGRGGFAEAWRVKCESGEDAVGKFLHERGSCDMAARRLRSEADILQHLDVPGIPRLLGSDALDGMPYLLLERIEGCHWRELGHEVSPTLPVLLRCCGQIARTLAQLHAKNIVHADLKPENILFGRGKEGGWRNWIIDFGLARDIGSCGTRITTEGQTVGTMGYLDPRHVDEAVERDMPGDIYALGATFYEWYTRRPLFLREEWLRTLSDIRLQGRDAAARHLHTAALRWNESLSVRDTRFESLILRMCDPEAERRPSSLEVAEMLEAWTKNVPLAPLSARTAREAMHGWNIECTRRTTRRRFLSILTGVVGGGTAGVGLWRTATQDPAPAQQKTNILPLPSRLAIRREPRSATLSLEGRDVLSCVRDEAAVLGSTRAHGMELWRCMIGSDIACATLERMRPGSSAGLPRRTYPWYWSFDGQSALLLTTRGIVVSDDEAAEFRGFDEPDDPVTERIRRHLARWPDSGRALDRMLHRPRPEEAADGVLLERANDALREAQQRLRVRQKIHRSAKGQ